MSDAARQKLSDLVARYGPDVVNDVPRCEALVRDMLADHRREVNLLVSALRERSAAELRAAGSNTASSVLIARLARRLEDSLGLAPEAAHWAVETWAVALGVIAPTAASVAPPLSPMAPPSGPAPNGPASGAGTGGPQLPHGTVTAVPATSRSNLGLWIALGALCCTLLGVGVVVGANQYLQSVNGRTAETPRPPVPPPALTPAPEKPRTPVPEITPATSVTAEAEARRLIRRADARRRRSATLVERRRTRERTRLEDMYGKTWSGLEDLYHGYPYDEHISAYRGLASEARADATRARRLTLGTADRNALVRYLNLQATAFDQFRSALEYEQVNGFLATRSQWSNQYQTYKSVGIRRKQVGGIFGE